MGPFQSQLLASETPGTPRAKQREAQKAARGGAIAVWDRDRCPIRIAGADHLRWLHGQCSQDVKGLPEGAAARGWILDARGQNLGDLSLGRVGNEILATIPAVASEAILRHFDRAIIAEDVQISRLDGTLILVLGVAVPTLLLRLRGLPTETPGPTLSGSFNIGGGTVYAIQETGYGVPATSLVAEASTLSPLCEALEQAGVVVGSPDAADALAIAAGRPKFGRDVDARFLPKETGQESTTVSYTKGCYTGQEVVAKQHFLGAPRRMVRRAEWRGGAIAPGTSLHRPDGTPLGRMTASAPALEPGRYVGLVLIEGPGCVHKELVLRAEDEDGEPVSVVLADAAVQSP